ncbi:MAG: 5-methyltetrahydrofolate--homocysteine methyltransferase [Clostridia bacterium]|uniref:Trimethylamine corrinoid protein 1 n=1 Tax=Thermacetogenium phaeum TaxID=85874 RepID=A0A117LBE8_9THEO|nr:MAG: Trimethylamine corrinoid protein 1 [Thermacetogenium phaeum]MDK2880375.1 5-methyltetrahydrofolate--homocysteine methyltransferase [Clostridia bacterium]MDN5365491.1 5-methyltetrahydrofolate--homocysteine methyltransferase [Thermacetogenium sp.]MDN5374995.1 5-methyltetrahydrofolate--homocysteine methyltransferase [Thermacetogenium sp.]
MSSLKELIDLVIAGDVQGVKEATKRLLEAGEEPLRVINEALIPGINEVGVRFKEGEMFVPEMMMSAQAMKAGVELAKEMIGGAEVPAAGKVVIGSVKGDLHDIGKNLVIMMLESSGFSIVDLGVDAAPEKFVQAVKEHQPHLVGMSALLTTTMPVMQEVIAALEKEGLRDAVKVIIGGAPVTREYAEEIGADGYAPDAGAAVELCKQLVN